MAARYHFVSEYVLRGDRTAIWRNLAAVDEWPRWWRWLPRVEVLRAGRDEDGLGAIYRNHATTPTHYGFTYMTETVEVDHGRRIDAVSSGDLVGRGRFLLRETPSGDVALSFAWLVETSKWWMNLLAPIARPAFGWNHDRLMRDFGRGLASASGATLVSFHNSIVKPGAPGFYELPALSA